MHVILQFRGGEEGGDEERGRGEKRYWCARRGGCGENGERKKGEMREKESERERQSQSVCLISGRIIWLAGGKLLYQSPKGRSDFLNHFNKLEECDCPDSAAVSVLIRHSALSELATHEPSKHITINGLLSACNGKANPKHIIQIHCHTAKSHVTSYTKKSKIVQPLYSSAGWNNKQTRMIKTVFVLKNAFRIKCGLWNVPCFAILISKAAPLPHYPEAPNYIHKLCLLPAEAFSPTVCYFLLHICLSAWSYVHIITFLFQDCN